MTIGAQRLALLISTFSPPCHLRLLELREYRGLLLFPRMTSAVRLESTRPNAPSDQYTTSAKQRVSCGCASVSDVALEPLCLAMQLALVSLSRSLRCSEERLLALFLARRASRRAMDLLPAPMTLSLRLATLQFHSPRRSSAPHVAGAPSETSTCLRMAVLLLSMALCRRSRFPAIR